MEKLDLEISLQQLHYWRDVNDVNVISLSSTTNYPGGFGGKMGKNLKQLFCIKNYFIFYLLDWWMQHVISTCLKI